MIGFLRGKVAQLSSDSCVMDVNGIGYRVHITSAARNQLKLDGEALLHTHMSVREDDISLYGFSSQGEYELFLLLISVSGIGPKVAVGILSAISVDRLCQVIGQKQIGALTKLPGVGKKTAERLILELKDKVHFLEDTATDIDAELPDHDESSADDHMSEALMALQALGYSQQELSPVLKKARGMTDTEDIIRFVLKEYAGKR